MGIGRRGERGRSTGLLAGVAALAAFVAGCAAGDGDEDDPATAPLDPELAAAVDAAVTDAARAAGEPLLTHDPDVYTALADALAEASDQRAGWVMVDLGQFVFRPEPAAGLIEGAGTLAGETFEVRTWWKGLGDHLITTDVPAPPGLLDWKRDLYGAADTTFLRLLDDGGRRRLASRLLRRRAPRRPPVRLPRDLLVHPRPRRPAGGAGRRRRLVSRPSAGVRDRGRRRVPGLPAAHHGGPRAGQRHARRAPDLADLLHAVPLGGRSPARRAAAGGRAAGAAGPRACCSGRTSWCSTGSPTR